MKAEIHQASVYWYFKVGSAYSDLYTRRRDAKRGLLRFLKGMEKGVEVPV